MPIVFEEVTGEVEPKRGSASAASGETNPAEPSQAEMCEQVARHLHLMAERCQRSLAD
jgi:hypothetical protein